MEYRRLGHAGLQVSAIGLGGTTFGTQVDSAQSTRIIHQALDMGVNFIDASAAYGRGASQEVVGKAIADRRSQVVLSARLVGGPTVGTGPNESGMGRLRITEGVHQALRRFNTDYIDLFEGQLPVAGQGRMEEMLRTFDDLVRAGKLRYVGASNYAAWQLAEASEMAQAYGLSTVVAVEARYNLLTRGIEQDFIPACRAYNVGIIPYTPLAAGFLTGKYRRGEPIPEGVRGYNNPTFSANLTDRNFTLVEALQGFAQERGHTVGELALAWLLTRPQVCSVIAGATSPAQVVENGRAEEWQLSEEDLSIIDKITLDGVG